jgi:hypothetical protein
MIMLMLIILMVQLQSFQKMILVISVAPLGLIGVVLALLPTRTPMGFVAILGIIALSGMIIRNSVILIDQIDIDMAKGLHPWDAVVDATTHRFRPIVLTAAAASLGMIPIASEVFWGPMAYAIIGGLFVATPVNAALPAGALCRVVPHQGAAQGARASSRSGDGGRGSAVRGGFADHAPAGQLSSGVNAFGAELGLDGREQAEGMVVGRELIVAGCNPPTLFDLVEKPT